MNQRAIGIGIGAGLGGLIGTMIAISIWDSKNTDMLLSYGSLSINGDTVTYTNKEEQVKLALHDGTLIEQTPIAKQAKSKKEKQAEPYFRHNDLTFRYVDRVLEVYRDEKQISTLHIGQAIFAKDNILYGSRGDVLYRINLDQLN